MIRRLSTGCMRVSVMALLFVPLLVMLAGREPADATLPQVGSPNPSSTIAIGPGALSISLTGSLNFAVTLNGTDQTPTPNAAPTITIVDATGTGSGYHVTVGSTNFTGPNNDTTTVLASNFTYTTNGSTTRFIGQGGSAQTPSEEPPAALALGSTPTIVTAAVNSGMGTYTWSPPASAFSLVVPASAFAGSYTANLTLTLTTGPQ